MRFLLGIITLRVCFFIIEETMFTKISQATSGSNLLSTGEKSVSVNSETVAEKFVRSLRSI